MACGNNHVTRDYLSTPPTPAIDVPAIPSIRTVRTARLVAITREHIASGAAKPSLVASGGDNGLQNARDLLEVIQTRSFFTDTSVNSPERSTDTITVVSGYPGVVAEIYHGGLGKPDGPGHAHSQLMQDGTTVTLRDAYDPLVLYARQAAKLDQTR